MTGNVEQVFDLYGDMILRLAMARTGNRQDGEDLLQEGFLFPSTRKLNTATTALKGMVYVPTALSRQALYFFANRINFKLKSVDS